MQTDGQVNEGRELSEEACRNRAERGLGNEAHGNSHRRCKGSRHGERISAWDKASATLSHGCLEQCLREGGSELQVVAPLHSIAHLGVEGLERRISLKKAAFRCWARWLSCLGCRQGRVVGWPTVPCQHLCPQRTNCPATYATAEHSLDLPCPRWHP